MASTATEALERHTALNIAKERKAGKSWEQIAKRFVFASADDVKSAYFRWQRTNNIRTVN